MSQEIQTAIEAVNDALETNVPNIVKAYDYPIEALFEERCVMTYYGGGIYQTQDASFNKGLHDIVCDFIVFRQDYGNAMQKLMTDVDLIYSALTTDTTFGGAISTFSDVECSEPIDSTWAGAPILILRFTLHNAKIM